jgi:hypothetical protein
MLRFAYFPYVFVYLVICGLFNRAISSSDCTAATELDLGTARVAHG